MSRPKINLAIGIVLTITGMTMISGAVAIGVTHYKGVKDLVSKNTHEATPLQIKSCEDSVKKMQFTSRTNNYDLTVSTYNMTDTDQTFKDMSLVAMTCNGYQMKSFCAGEHCPGGSVVMTLTSK